MLCHPRDNETYKEAAHRRLKEELGFDCVVEEKFHFIYKAKLGKQLYEHELDRVFVGYYEGDMKINPEEVRAVKWISMEELIEDMKSHPENYTAWFKIIFEKYLEKLEYASND